MGEEPRPALIIKLIPTAFVNSPMVNSVYLLTVSFFDIFITFLFGGKIKQFFFGKFIAKFQSLLSVRVRFVTFAGMNQQREFRKSEEPFYFVCYDKLTQKELYERNYKLIKVAEGGTITLSCCGETLTAKEGDYLVCKSWWIFKNTDITRKKRPFSFVMFESYRKVSENICAE